MSRYLFCFVCLLLCQMAEARLISIEGKIDHPEGGELLIAILENELTAEERVFKLNSSSGQFNMSLDIGQSNWLYLRYQQFSFRMFVADQDEQLSFQFDAQSPATSLFFKGKNANNNNALKHFIQSAQKGGGKEVNYQNAGLQSRIDAEVARQARAYSAEDYFRVRQSDYQFLQQFLFRQTQIDSKLFAYLNKAIGWRYETDKIAYFLFNKDRLRPSDIQKYWTRFSLLQQTDISDDESVSYPAYQNLLAAFIHYLQLESPGEPDSRDLSAYQFINGNLTGRSRFFMLAKLMLEAYRVEGNIRLAQRKFKQFKIGNPFPAYTQTLEEIFGEQLEYIPQKTVPDFLSMGLQEESIRLSDYAGRVVYISFWASWCGPCLKGFRETAAIRRQLEQEGVVFLNINFDDNPDIWKRALGRNDLSGLNVFPVDLSALQEEFRIGALPHYILVNKSGKLTYLSSEDLNFSAEEFRALLME